MLVAAESPTWLTLLTGIGIGGLLGTLLSVNHERAAEFRTRMLNAADEFLQAVSAIANAVAPVRWALERDPRQEDEIKDAMRTFEDLHQNLLPKAVRLELVFGPTPTVRYAGEILDYFHEMREALIDWRHGVPAAAEAALALIDNEDEDSAPPIDKFGDAARLDVRRTGFRLLRPYRG